MSALAWWSVARPNGTPRYGYGTEEQAREWARRLDGDDPGGIDCHAIAEERWYDEATRNDGYDIASEIEESKGWVGGAGIREVVQGSAPLVQLDPAQGEERAS